MDKSAKDNNNDSEEKKAPIISLQKAYMWGIVLCVVILIAVILYNNLRTPPEPNSPNVDYLALLRDSHERAIALRGISRIGNKTIEEFEKEITGQTGQTLIFPDWFSLLPSVTIVGARIAEIGEDKSVNLIFTLDTHTVDYITIFNSRQEISDLESVMFEEQVFHKYQWGAFKAYFWELNEDNAPVTYGLISDQTQEELEMMTTDTMRSLKNYYLPKE